ncbi:hypothetical protein ABZ835_34170 [Streptomyces sp. NPDC047461]|uniref:hypothetical protein n=1 Tax=Streptomyces sp. NPDC047461 TaxID=3155619 RepID=UPI0033C371E2
MAETGLATDIWTELNARCLEFLRRAQREGLLDPAADLEWTRRVYYALISEALHGPGADRDPDAQDPDALATRLVDALLRGAGPRG